MITLTEAQKQGSTFFLTIKSIDGLPILLNREYYRIALDSLKFCRENKGWEIYAYTILINHLHLVLMIKENFSLVDTVSDFKKYTANKILKQLRSDKEYDLLDELKIAANKTNDRESKVWRRDCYPKTIYSKGFLLQKIRYTDLNARKHKVVQDIENYLYTSYHNHYCNHEAILEIDDVLELL